MTFFDKTEEKRLFRDVKNNDKDAFIKSYDLYFDQIFRFIFFKVNDREEAQDITSAVFLKAWNHIQNNSVTDIKTLKALYYKIARTSVIDHYRKNSKNATIKIDDQNLQIDIPDRKSNPLEQMVISSDIEQLKEKMLRLKDEYREMIVMKYVDDLTTKEIAQTLNKSRGNVRITLHRALKALREILDEKNNF
jgi:RNA polymerase sigma-70 factor (ECF subfamily)